MRRGSWTSRKSGRRSISPTVLKPNQRVRVVLTDDHGALRFNAAVAWASFEIPPKRGPQYRAGVNFVDADGNAVGAFCIRHKQFAGPVLKASTVKLHDLAERLQCRLEGDGDVEILRLVPIENAGPGDLTFIANPKYLSKLAATRASAVIVGETLHNHSRPQPAVRVVAQPRSVHILRAGCRPVRAKPPAGQRSRPAQLGRARRRDWRRRVDRSLRRDRVRRVDRSGHHHLPERGHRARRGHRRRLHPALPRRDSGTGRPGPPRDGPERRRHRLRRLRLRDATRWQPSKIPQQADVVIEDDVEIGANSDDRSARRRRDAHPRRHEDRQPGADRPRRDDRAAGTAGLASRDFRQRRRGRRRRDGRPGGGGRPPARREGRHRGRQDRHHQIGGARASS